MNNRIAFVSENITKKEKSKSIKLTSPTGVETIKRDEVYLSFFLNKGDGNKFSYKYAVTPKQNFDLNRYSEMDGYLADDIINGKPFYAYPGSLIKVANSLAAKAVFFEYSNDKNGCTKRDQTVKLNLSKLDKMYKDSSDQSLYYKFIEKHADCGAVSTGLNKFVRNIVVVDIDHNDGDECSFQSLLDDYDKLNLNIRFLVKKNTASGHFQLYLFLNRGLLVKTVTDNWLDIVRSYTDSLPVHEDVKVEFNCQALLQETENFARYKTLTKYLNQNMHGDSMFRMWRIKNPAAEFNGGTELETYMLYRDKDNVAKIEQCDYMEFRNSCMYDFDELYDMIPKHEVDKYKNTSDIIKFTDDNDNDNDVIDIDNDDTDTGTVYRQQINYIDFSGNKLDNLIDDIKRHCLGRETFIMNRVLSVVRKKYGKYINGKTMAGDKLTQELILKNDVVKTIMSEFKRLMKAFNGVFPGTVHKEANSDSHYIKLIESLTKKAIATFDDNYRNGNNTWTKDDRKTATGKKQSQAAVKYIFVLSYIMDTKIMDIPFIGSHSVNYLMSSAIRQQLTYYIKNSNATKLSKEIAEFFKSNDLMPGSIKIGNDRSVYNFLNSISNGSWDKFDSYIDAMVEASKVFTDRKVKNNFYNAVISGIKFKADDKDRHSKDNITYYNNSDEFKSVKEYIIHYGFNDVIDVSKLPEEEPDNPNIMVTGKYYMRV